MTKADAWTEDVMIRLAAAGDHDQIKEIFRRSVLEGQLRAGDTGADIDNLQDAYFADDGASAFWVACRGDIVVGMIGVQRTKPNTAEICRLRVHEEHRRRGIGSKLLLQAMNFCREQGYLKVVLDVRIERGPAIAIFQKFGFTHSRTREIEDRKLLDFYLDLYSEPT